MSFHFISFIHSFMPTVHFTFRSFHPFIHSSIHPFIHSFIHSLIRSFIVHSFFSFPFFHCVSISSFQSFSFHFMPFAQGPLAPVAAFMAPSVISSLALSNHAWSIHSPCCHTQLFPIGNLFLVAMSLFRNFRPGRCQALPGRVYLYFLC